MHSCILTPSVQDQFHRTQQYQQYMVAVTSTCSLWCDFEPQHPISSGRMYRRVRSCKSVSCKTAVVFGKPGYSMNPSRRHLHKSWKLSLPGPLSTFSKTLFPFWYLASGKIWKIALSRYSSNSLSSIPSFVLIQKETGHSLTSSHPKFPRMLD